MVRMREVTDPGILSQLNAPSAGTQTQPITSGMKEVTDPNILAQLNGTSSQTDNSLLSQVVNSPGIQGILGAGDALRNTLSTTANILPGVNIAPVQSSTGTAYDIGKIAGNVGGFLGGGEALDTARAAAEGIPMAGRLSQWLGGSSLAPTMARQGAGSAIYGGLATNQDRADNSIGGGVMGAGLAALPFGAGKLAQGIQYFQPQKFASQILDNLSGGQSMQDATKSVLSAVKTAYQKQKDEASDLYDSVNNSVPASHIYEDVKKPDPLMSLDPSQGYTGFYRPQETKFDINSGINGQYPNLPQQFFNYPTYDLSNLHNNFIDNPTFQNAHKLQSLLGQTAAQIQSGLSNPETLNTYGMLNSARGALKSDISSFLQKQDPALVDKYNQASDFFKNNVVPYTVDPTIKSIAEGETTNIVPAALANIFKAQEPNMAKVVSDLPEGTVDKMLYTQLGKNTPSQNPFAMIRAYGRLNEQGLGDYISPELDSQMQSLQNRLKWRSLLQSTVGGLVGAAGGAHHGGAGAIGMGAAGAALGSPFMNYLGRRLPISQIGDVANQAAKLSYPYLSSAYLSSTLNNSGGQ